MSNPENDKPQPSDMELSPEARAALGKARRSFAFSISILLLGFMAIAFALVYRVMRDSPPPTTADVVSIPAGAEVISAFNADGTVQVTYRAGGATILSIFDAATGTLRRTIQIGSE